ncbi:MAG: GAF domain-containing protein [Anaerolineales bacterium]|jgi:signal transduction histidine kinase
MTSSESTSAAPNVVVIADIRSNAQGIIDRILSPAGIHAWQDGEDAPPPDVLVVDVSQLRGDPLAGLRARRAKGDEAPAIVLAAHFPAARLRDLFRTGVADVLLKPYKGVDLCRAIFELREARATEVSTQMLARRLQSTREQARQRTEEIRWLSEIGRVVASLDDLDEILRRLVEAAAFLTDAEEANIYLAEPDTDEVVLRASKQVGERHGTLQRLRTTDTLAGQVYRTGQPLLRKPQWEGGPVKVQTGFLVQSLIKVPIRVGKDVVGVLGVYNRMAPRSFNEHHLGVLMALADWAGVALEHAAQPSAPATAKAAAASAAETPEKRDEVSAVPAGMLKGLKSARQLVHRLANDPAGGNLTKEQRQLLAALSRVISELERMPLTVIDDQHAKGLVNLSQISRKVAEELQLAASQRGLQLVVEPGQGLPLVNIDQDQTQRVVQALTAAAIRRTRRGRVVLGVHSFQVTAGRSDTFPLPDRSILKDGLWLAIRVADTSGGLSPDTVRAFEEPVPDPGAGRLGPGLSMGEIRMIVESMGGHLWHEQTPASTAIVFAIPSQ